MRRRQLFVWIAAVVLIGCMKGRDVDLTLPPTSADVVGTFVLASANGVAPPFTAFVTDTEQWNLQSDAIVLATDGTWAETTNYLVFANGDTTSDARQSVVSGTYAVENSQIDFVMTSGGSDTFAGSVTGNALIVLFKGTRFTYTR